MKKILILNKVNMLISFNILYCLPHLQKPTEVKSGNFASPLFRIFEIPDKAFDVITTIKAIDCKGKKQLIRQDNQEHASDMFYGVYRKNCKFEFRDIDISSFMGACSVYGVNNTSTITRATIIYYDSRKDRQFYVSGPLKKGEFFAFVIPSKAIEIQIKVEKAKDVEKNLWISIYTEVFLNKSYPYQKCYEISKPLFESVQCHVVNCSKL